MTPGISHSERRWHWLVLISLCLLWASALVFSTILIDPARDLSAALRMAQDAEWPLAGPLIGERFYLGPIWFWVLGGLVWLLDQFVLVALAVGLLGALKFPLAWACGRELGDPRLGLVWASVLALPGWHSVAQYGVGHTVFLEAAILWVVWLSLRYWRLGRPSTLIWAGLAWAMAVHAHPSAAIIAVFPALAWVIRSRQQGHWPVLPLLLAMLLASLPFMPLLGVQAVVGAGGLDPSLSGLAGATLDIVLGTTLGGAMAAGEFLLQPLPGASRWPWIAMTLAIAGAVGWLRVPGRLLLPMLLAAGFVLAAAVWLAMLRDRTPVYMTYLLSPAIAFLFATGLRFVLRGRALSACLLGCLSVVAVMAAGAVTYSVAKQADNGIVLVPGVQLADVRAYAQPWDLEPASVLPIWADELNADRWCTNAAGQITLHGELAALTDMSLALSSQRQCRGRSRLRIGGRQGDQHEFALPAMIVEALDVPVAGQLGNLVRIEPFEVHHPPMGIEIPDGRSYPARPGQGPPEQAMQWDIRSSPGSYLAVVELHPWSAPLAMLQVRVNGREIEPVARTRYTRIYECRLCFLRDARWQVAMQVSSPSSIELITFDSD